MQREIIDAKPPKPPKTTPLSAPKKVKTTKVFVGEVSEAAKARETIEEASGDVSTKSATEDYDFDKEISELLDLRKKSPAFHPAVILGFPTLLDRSIKNLCANPEVLQPGLYGGFVYGSNPKDLDFQIVMRNDFFVKKSDEEAISFLRGIFPAELKVKCSKHIIPRTDGKAVWKVAVGEFVESTFIEQRHHFANQNWTSNIDAQIYDLKRQVPCCQPTFLQRFGFRGGEINHNSLKFPFTINEKAKDWPIRLSCELIPDQLTPEYVHRAVNYFERFFEKSVEINEDGSIKNFNQKLSEKAIKFLEHHPMNEEDAAIFNQNINAICLLRASLLEEAKQN